MCYTHAVIGNVIVNETGCVYVADGAFSGGGCGGNWGGRKCATSPSHKGRVGDQVERCEDQETEAFRRAGLDGELQGTIPCREIEPFCAEKMEKGGGDREVEFNRLDFAPLCSSFRSRRAVDPLRGGKGSITMCLYVCTCAMRVFVLSFDLSKPILFL